MFFRRKRLSADARAYLRADNPTLVALRERLADHPVVTNSSLWTHGYIATNLDMTQFRADNAYRWQTRPGFAVGADGQLARVPTTDRHYEITAAYVRAHDRLKLLDVLSDDALFGNHVVDVDGFAASTDRLDSALQLDFLDRHIGLDSLQGRTVIDVGAGYGRFAHRLAEAVPGLRRVVCTDAVAESIFLCDYYLRFRGVDAVAEAVAIDEIDGIEENDAILAVNMHSFPEMPLSSIEWWLALLARKRVRYLFVVPNASNRVSREIDGSKLSFEPAIAAAGYQLIAAEPKYRDPGVQRNGLWPGEHLLYARRGA